MTRISRRIHYSAQELGLAAAILGLSLAAVLLPALPQDPAYHRFADSRAILGVPHALNTLSNLAFVAMGMYGLRQMSAGRLMFFDRAMNLSAIVFFTGFVLTGLASAWYHLAPDDSGLAWDRLGMIVAFAGVLGMAAAQRVSARAGFGLLVVTLILGPLSVVSWQATGSVTPYAVVQFGGIAALLGLLFCSPHGPGPNWAALVAAYALAKLFEIADAQVFALSGHLVSGHTLKHLAAALAGLAVTRALPRADG